LAFSRPKDGRRRRNAPDEGAFVAAVSNIHSFIKEPSPALRAPSPILLRCRCAGRERANAAVIPVGEEKLLLADHHADDFVAGGFLGLAFAGILATAEHHDAVGHFENVAEIVRDEDDALAFSL